MTTQSPLQSSQQSPLWPARLHHIQIGTPQPAAMAAFYQRTFGYQATLLADGRRHLRGGERRLLIAEGAARSVGFGAYALASPRQLAALRGHLEERGIAPQPSPTPLFTAAAFAVRTMRVTFDRIPQRYENVALTLGCNRSRAFWMVIMPQARYGVLAAGTLAWARALGEFGPILVFAGSTRMRTEVLPTSVFLEMQAGSLKGMLAISLLMIFTAAVVLIVARLFGMKKGDL